MFRLKLPWQMKFLLRGVWLGGIVLILGAVLVASGRPTTIQRTLGRVMMFGSLPLGILAFLVSWLRRQTSLSRQARAARRVVPGVGAVSTARPSRRAMAARASRPTRRPVAARR